MDPEIVLSPFELVVEKDLGFVAASSLAGGKLAGDLATTPVPYSVLTREFIDALNITDVVQAMEWTVNAGNNPDNGTNDSFGTAYSYNIRGVGANRPNRNFFPFNVNYDSYNLERFDFARGPNAILFGNGSIGGTVNIVTKQPSFSRPKQELTTTLGSWNNKRAVLDVNRPVNAKFALRLNAVWEDREAWRDGDWGRKKGVFLSTLTKVTPATQVRLEAEYGEMVRRNSYNFVPDNFSGWDGKSTYSTLFAAAPTDAGARGIARYGTTYVISPASGTNDIISYAGAMRTQAAGQSTSIPILGILPKVALTTSSVSVLHALNLPPPEQLYATAIANSKFRLPSERFSITPGGPSLKQRFKDFTAFVNHRIGKSLFLELAADRNYEERPADLSGQRGINATWIDINSKLPTGAPNPYFLEPYNEGPRYKSLRSTEATSIRAALGYVGKLPWGAGDIKFNLLGGQVTEDVVAAGWIYSLRNTADSRTWWNTNLPVVRFYWNQPDRQYHELGTVTLQEPFAGRVSTVAPGWVLDNTRPELESITKNRPTFGQAAVNLALFKGRLNLLGAARYDSYDTKVQYGRFAMDYPDGWDSLTTMYKPAPPADYMTMKYVPKTAAGVATGPAIIADVRPRDGTSKALPQYANDRFRDDYSPLPIKGKMWTYSSGGVFQVLPWLSVYGNYAQTYNPPTSVPRIDSTLIAATVSNGYDFGLRMQLLNRRLTVNIGRYLTSEDNSSTVNPISTVSVLNRIIGANVFGDTSGDGVNIRGVQILSTTYTDKRKRMSDGYEFEAVANLTRSWRLMTNASIAHAYQSDAFPETRAYLAANDAVFRQIMEDAQINIDANNVATVRTVDPKTGLTLDPALRPADSLQAATAWNDLQTQKAGLVTGKQKISGVTEVTANLFSDYTLREGKLKGLRLGFGVQHRGRRMIGNRAAETIVNPANPNAAIDDPSVDAYSYVYAKPYTMATATLGYTFKLRQKRTLSCNLRIENLFNYRQVLYYNTALRPLNGDLNTPARVQVGNNFSYVLPTNYTLSTTLSF